MSKQRIIKAVTLSAMGLLASTPSIAGAPVWSVTPIGNTTITVPANVQASISYRITNNSSKAHKLVMQPIAGLTQVLNGPAGSCSSPFTLPNKGSSCVLTLQTPSTGLTAGIYGGPSICTADVNGNPDTSQCYQPETQSATLNLQPAPATALGDRLGGGTVACLDGAPYDNFIAATNDNSSGIQWYNNGTYTITNATSDDDGLSNTNTIVTSQGATITNYAAGLCQFYSVDSAGNSPCQAGNTCYDDWFLPAKNQLYCLYTNRVIVGGFSPVPYWSSSEDDAPVYAWAQIFADGVQLPFSKSLPWSVRCVRALSL